MVGKLSPTDQERLISAMHTIEACWAKRRRRTPLYPATPRPGDMGWIVSRHGAL